MMIICDSPAKNKTHTQNKNNEKTNLQLRHGVAREAEARVRGAELGARVRREQALEAVEHPRPHGNLFGRVLDARDRLAAVFLLGWCVVGGGGVAAKGGAFLGGVDGAVGRCCGTRTQTNKQNQLL